MEILSDEAVVVLTGKNLKTLVRLLAEEMRSELGNTRDNLMLTPSKLAKEIGISETQIRQAMSRGKYGRDVGEGARSVYRATVSEARQYHFEDGPRKIIADAKREDDLFFTGRARTK